MENINNIFEVPYECEPFVHKMISKDEENLILRIKNNRYSLEDLKELVKEVVNIDSEEFINNCYKRSIINKEEIDNEIYYKVSNVYSRLAVFAQFEVDTWESIDKDIRKNADEWYVKEYAKRSIHKVDKLKKGELSAIENAYFITLEESLELISSKEQNLYLVPCNCKSIAKNCSKPTNVCIEFRDGINTMADRGWATIISKEEAKEVIRKANKSGLMHSSECEDALCNCDGCCCYPIRASKILGTEKEWPKKVHEISFEKDKCIGCGKCSKICNFNAFTIKDKIISFDEDKCWGCTICKDNCPTSAIKLKI